VEWSSWGWKLGEEGGMCGTAWTGLLRREKRGKWNRGR